MSESGFVALGHDGKEKKMDWAEESDGEEDEQVWNTTWSTEAIDISQVKEGDDEGHFPEAPVKPVEETRPARKDYSEYRRPPRLSAAQKLEMLNSPPWTAFIGNLLPTTREEELHGFFGELGVVTIRLIPPTQNRQYTFAYIEFETKDGLADAIKSNGFCMQEDRKLKVDVADNNQRRNDRGNRNGGNRRGYNKGSRYGDRYDGGWGPSSGERREYGSYNNRYQDRERRPAPRDQPPREQPPREQQPRRPREDIFGGALAKDHHAEWRKKKQASTVNTEVRTRGGNRNYRDNNRDNATQDNWRQPRSGGGFSVRGGRTKGRNQPRTNYRKPQTTSTIVDKQGGSYYAQLEETNL